MEVTVIFADYKNPQHEKDICKLMSEYAQDPMGGGEPLSGYVQLNLVKEISKVPNAFSVLVHVDSEAAALINCFEGFSTFKCKPLVNIHDVIVAKNFRGLGLSQLMLSKVEERARERGCCKITLEVLEGNEVARNSYEKFGFAGYELDPQMGKALFWQKVI